MQYSVPVCDNSHLQSPAHTDRITRPHIYVAQCFIILLVQIGPHLAEALATTGLSSGHWTIVTMPWT